MSITFPCEYMKGLITGSWILRQSVILQHEEGVAWVQLLGAARAWAHRSVQARWRESGISAIYTAVGSGRSPSYSDAHPNY